MNVAFDAAVSLRHRLEKVRTRRPLIHHITNFVVMNETANVTLCLGALPVMAHARGEVEEMSSMAGALVINMGTPYPETEESMVAAGKAANRAGIPVVFDPVGAGATTYRNNLAERLVSEVEFAVIRGNAAEMAFLAGAKAEIRGVESIGAEKEAGEIAADVARSLGCTAAVTGPVDAVCDGKRTVLVANGHPFLGKVTGTGCMATTAIAVLAAAGGSHLESAALGLALFGLAGEDAASRSEGPGDFHVQLYNSLYRLALSPPEEGLKLEFR